MTREEAARAFAEKMGWKYDGEAWDERKQFNVGTPNKYGEHPQRFPLPAPDAPLHEHLEFVGRVAEAIGARDVAVSWTRMPFKDRVGFVLSPDPRAPDAKRHERHGYHEGGDLCHAALLAALAALEAR